MTDLLDIARNIANEMLCKHGPQEALESVRDEIMFAKHSDNLRDVEIYERVRDYINIQLWEDE